MSKKLNNYFIKNLAHYADILAILFFALLIIYFYNIKDKSIMEYVLFFFSISGFILDILFTLIFLSNKKNNNLAHYGDILAIPFFALLIFYFYNIKYKSTTEYILFFFSISGFILDILFTLIFFFI